MKSAFTFACLLLAITPVAQPQDVAHVKGSIYGTAFGNDGKPARRIGLTAMPLNGLPLATLLPHTTTNDIGEYRFDLPWWGKYTVYAEDEAAGYSSYSTGRYGRSDPSTAEITPGHREAEMTIILPPKAAFLHVRLTNRVSGTPISAMRITVLREGSPSLVFQMSCYSTKVVLLPPDEDLIIHLTADGFREWKESAGSGQKLHLGSGENLALDVELDPAD
jgi:hypothetical protein